MKLKTITHQEIKDGPRHPHAEYLSVSETAEYLTQRSSNGWPYSRSIHGRLIKKPAKATGAA